MVVIWQDLRAADKEDTVTDSGGKAIAGVRD